MANKARRALRQMAPGGKVGLIAVALVLLVTGVAMAISTGLQNPGFESPLGSDNWSASTYRDGVYHAANCPDPTARDQAYDEVCQVSGNDSFTVRDGVYETPRGITVSPVEGSHMVRLGGPFNDSSQNQPEGHSHQVSQTFQVPSSSDPQMNLSYNIFTFDYQGYDNFGVELTGQQGKVLYQTNHGGYGPSGDINLKTTGWQPLNVDLAGLQGQTITLKIWAEGTRDNLYGFWAYLDGPGATASGAEGGSAQGQAGVDPKTGHPVPVETYQDPNTNETFFVVPQEATSDFSGGCVPLSVSVPINPGAGSVSNPTLSLVGNHTTAVPMTATGTNRYSATIPCAEDGTLYVDYDLTEGSTTQHFTVPIGGVSLIDPSGAVVDNANGKPVSGATVQLYRKDSSGSFSPVLSGDPGISPNVDPETTGSDGSWVWDVSAGTYHVVVTKSGYNTLTSSALVVSAGHSITGDVLRLVATSTGSGGGQSAGGQSGGSSSHPGGSGGGSPGSPHVTAGSLALGATKVSGSTVKATFTCSGGTACSGVATLSVVETKQHGKVVAVVATHKKKLAKPKRTTVVVGTATVSVPAGASRTITVSLNGTGKLLLASRKRFPAALTVTRLGSGTKTVAKRTVTFKAAKPNKKHQGKHHKKG